MLLLLWLRLFILSGVTSPLISSSILGSYQPGEFIFQCPIFLLFHTVHGVLKERILKCFAIPFSSGLHFVTTLHHDPSILGGLTWQAHSFIELDKAVVHVISLVCFLWLWFSFRLPSGTPLQYSCLGNSMDTRVWWATVHEVAKNLTRLSH